MPVRLNLVNLNKQSKMYSQGMTPVFKVDLENSEKRNSKFSKVSWSRIKEIPTYQVLMISFQENMSIIHITNSQLIYFVLFLLR